MNNSNTFKKAYLIIDMQYGSTGKGLLAGYLAEKEIKEVVVTAWGPNAGHTYIDANGRTFIHRMLANGVVSPNLQKVLIGPGSVIDLDILRNEIESCKDLLIGKAIVIHPNAVVVDSRHLEHEKSFSRIGSTMKGTGAAVIERINRDPESKIIARDAVSHDWLDEIASMGINIAVSRELYNVAVSTADKIQIEGAQGFSLSIYHGFYPYTTSRDVTPAQVMADCAIPLPLLGDVYGTLRTFPIRVANRYDENGNMIGTSGPGYFDQEELAWEEIGVEPELTTVTKLPRRVFSFSNLQYVDSLWQCQPTKIFINFMNYIPDARDAEYFLLTLINEASNFGIDPDDFYIGEGPTVKDVFTYDQYRFMVINS